MNAVEIEEAISLLAEQEFDPAGFPFAFLEAFGNKKTTIDRLKKGESNASDIKGGVLQRNHIHMAVCADFLDQQRNLVLIGGTGTGKTHLAVSIARACITEGRRGRFFNVVDLVNKLDGEARAQRQDRTADLISRLDFLILDELG